MGQNLPCPKCSSENTTVIDPFFLNCTGLISCAGVVMLIGLVVTLPVVINDILDNVNVLVGMLVWAIIFLVMIAIQVPAHRLSKPYTVARCANADCSFAWNPYRPNHIEINHNQISGAG